MSRDSESISEKSVHLKYVGHIAVMTGKTMESMSLEEQTTIGKLISILDKMHPGFQETFMPPGGVFNSRTAILVRRKGHAPFNLINEDDRVQAGDSLTFW